jgi:hypothetical protein
MRTVLALPNWNARLKKMTGKQKKKIGLYNLHYPNDPWISKIPWNTKWYALYRRNNETQAVNCEMCALCVER